MRRFALPLALALFALAAPLASAGDAALPGCACGNECPLAQAANERRSTGEEAVLASKTVRAETVRFLVRNLGTI